MTYEAGGRAADSWFALMQVGLANVAGDMESIPAASLDRNGIGPRFSHDGHYVYFQLEDDRSMVLARLRLADRRVERLSPAGHVVREFDVDADEHTVLVDGTAERPVELFALQDGKLRALTNHNTGWLAQVALVPAIALDFKSPDGLSIGALLLTPPGPPPPSGWPTLVRLHGGLDRPSLQVDRVRRYLAWYDRYVKGG